MSYQSINKLIKITSNLRTTKRSPGKTQYETDAWIKLEPVEKSEGARERQGSGGAGGSGDGGGGDGEGDGSVRATL